MENEFPEDSLIFPTTLKDKIGSYLSWPIGAKALSDSLQDVPQAGVLKLSFTETWPKLHRGKYPEKLTVLSVNYLRYRNMHASGTDALPSWKITVYAVPRVLKPVIFQALIPDGIGKISHWLKENQNLQGREARMSFRLLWDQLAEAIVPDTYGTAVPQVIHDAGAKAAAAKPVLKYP